MKKLIILLLLFLISDSAYAFGINAAAVNTIKYNQNRSNTRQNTRNTLPYVYSEQQAKYYGINVANPNTQYRQYGLYKQNYSQNTNYTNRYGY